nr:FecR family protein [uncultured Carboxylicivirga sp.]
MNKKIDTYHRQSEEEITVPDWFHQKADGIKEEYARDKSLLQDVDDLEFQMLNHIHNRVTFKSKQQKTLQWLANFAAASVILAILAGGYLLIKPAKMITASNITEQIDSVLLADGSIIYLSPNAVFQYPDNFKGKTRSVYLLSGNAFFKIARNPAKPFLVKSGVMTTRVLGTSFNIHLSSQEYEVTVHTGKVNVSSDHQKVDLVPMQQAHFDFANNKLTYNKVPANAVLPWYNHNLSLVETSLHDIIEILEKKFGCECGNLSDDLLSKRVTIHIGKSATLLSVLNQINYISNLKLSINENNLIEEL